MADKILLNLLGRDISGLVQDYIIVDNRPKMDEIIRRMNKRAVWRITDRIKRLGVRWSMHVKAPWRDVAELYTRVMGHVDILDLDYPYHLVLIEPEDYMYDKYTWAYHVTLRNTSDIFHETGLDGAQG